MPHAVGASEPCPILPTYMKIILKTTENLIYNFPQSFLVPIHNSTLEIVVKFARIQ